MHAQIQKAFPDAKLVDGSIALRLARSVKTRYKVAHIRKSAAMLDKAFLDIPNELREGLAEYELAARIEYVMRMEQHQGLARVRRFNMEMHYGAVSFGDTAAYPHSFDGPVGVRGLYPAVPVMGGAKQLVRGEPIMVDMATSVTAEGKIRVAQNRGESVPEGRIIDHEGRPTTDPEDYLGEQGGAILPLGGVAGYKGYCLGFTVEVLGGLLSGEGCAAGDRTMHSNGVLFTVYDPFFFTEDDAYQEELENLIRHVHTSRVDPAIGEILLPGEPEFRSARQRQRNGIAVDDTTTTESKGVRAGSPRCDASLQHHVRWWALI